MRDNIRKTQASFERDSTSVADESEDWTTLIDSQNATTAAESRRSDTQTAANDRRHVRCSDVIEEALCEDENDESSGRIDVYALVPGKTGKPITKGFDSNPLGEDDELEDDLLPSLNVPVAHP